VYKKIVHISTYPDIHRAQKNRRPEWAQITLYNLVAYTKVQGRLSLSALTVFEILNGLERGPNTGASERFLSTFLPQYEVIYPDQEVIVLASKIDAALETSRQSIGAVDTMIAATAIAKKLVLVNANTKHFERIKEAGYDLKTANWRDTRLS